MATSNIRAFVDQIKATGEASKKPFADLVNKSLRNVAFRAASFTPKGDPSMIEAELLTDKLALKIVTKKLKKQEGNQVIDRYGNTKLTKTGRAKKHARTTRRLIALRAKQLIARRKKVVGYLRAGWFPAVRAFGGNLRGQGVRIFSPEAKLGSATPATIRSLLGKISNRVWDKIRGRAQGTTRSEMKAALDQAVIFVTKDMRVHQENKTIEAALRKHTDK